MTKSSEMDKQPNETEIQVLESFFAETELPDTLQLNTGVRVTNTTFYVKANLTIIQTAGNGLAKRTAMDRLRELREVLIREQGIRQRKR